MLKTSVSSRTSNLSSDEFILFWDGWPLNNSKFIKQSEANDIKHFSTKDSMKTNIQF